MELIKCVNKSFKEYRQHPKVTKSSSEVQLKHCLITQGKKRKMISGFVKAVIICDSSELTTSDTTTYRPNNIVVELLKKDPLRYGKVTFYKFTSEKEVREDLCRQFAILRNKRFWFASADQYGKLNFHMWDEWTGRNIRRWLPGSSAMYLILEGDGRKIPTLSNLLKKDSLSSSRKPQSSGITFATARPSTTHTTAGQATSKQHTPQKGLLEVNSSRVPLPRHKNLLNATTSSMPTSGYGATRDVDATNNKRHICQRNDDRHSMPSSQAGNGDENMCASKAPSENSKESLAVVYGEDDIGTSSVSSAIEVSSWKSSSSVLSFSTNSVANSGDGNKDDSSYKYEQGIGACKQAHNVTTAIENPLKRPRTDDQTSKASSNEEGTNLLKVTDCDNCPERCRLCPKHQKMSKMTSARDDGVISQKCTRHSTSPHEGRPSVITSSLPKSDSQISPLNATPLPFINPLYMIPKPNGTLENDQLKSIMELQEKMFSNLASNDAKEACGLMSPLNGFIFPGGVLPWQRAMGMPSMGKGAQSISFLPFAFPGSPYTLSSMAMNEVSVQSRMPETRMSERISKQEKTKLQRETKSKEEEERSASEVAPPESVSGNNGTITKSLDSLVDVFLAEEELQKTRYLTTDPDNLVEDMIPRSGFCEGGERFTLFLRHPIQDASCRTNLVARFGKGPRIPLQMINPFTLRGSVVPKSRRPRLVTVFLENASGNATGSVTYVYKDSFIDSMRTMMSSEQYGSHVIHSVIKTEDESTEEFLELLVYMSAKMNCRGVIEMVFSSSRAAAVYWRYQQRLCQPEDLARTAGHVEVAKYLESLKSRFVPEKAPQTPVNTSKESEDEEEPTQGTTNEGLEDETDNLMMLSSIASCMVTEHAPHTTAPSTHNSNPSHHHTGQKCSHKHKTSRPQARHNDHKSRTAASSAKESDLKPLSDGFLKKVFVLPWNSRYLPSQSELCKLRATQQTYGKVQFGADMSEQEVMSRIRSSFPEIKNTSFKLAVVDQTGKLVFYDGIWTGRIIRRKLRGNSVLYVVPCHKDWNGEMGVIGKH